VGGEYKGPVAVLATTGRPETLRPGADAERTHVRPRTWATDTEVFELVKDAHTRNRPGVRFYPQIANNAVGVYSHLRKRAQAHSHTTSMPQIARDHYDGCEDWQDGLKKRTTLRSALRRLEAAGLITWGQHHTVAGKFAGIYFELLEVPSEPESGLEPLTLRLQGECSTS